MKAKFDYHSFDEYWNECGDVYAMEVAEKVWDYQQSKIDTLTLQVAEMKSRLNDAYTDGQSAMYTARQSKVDELQKQLIDQGQRFNEQSQRLRDLEHKNGELRNRVAAVKTLIEEYKDPPTEDKVFRYALSIVDYELEQTLKGTE